VLLVPPSAENLKSSGSASRLQPNNSNNQEMAQKIVPDNLMHASNYFIKTFDVFRALL